MLIIVSSTEAVTLKVDPSLVLATRQYVDEKVLEVRQYADSLMTSHLKAADPHTQYAPKESPVLTGIPKAPTAAAGNSSTQLATTAFVQAALSALAAARLPRWTPSRSWPTRWAAMRIFPRRCLISWPVKWTSRETAAT